MINKYILKCDPEIFMMGYKFPISIGIVGESASGKSTITNEFINVFSKYFSINRINTDDYYYDNSKGVMEAGSFAEWSRDKNLDCPEAMDLELMKYHIKLLKKGSSTFLPKYFMDGSAVRIDKYKLAHPSDIIVSEGLFTMCVKDCFDITVYIDINEETQKERWYKRAEERQLGSSADILFKRAKEQADIYIRPYKNMCDIIISGEGPIPMYKELFEEVVSKYFVIKTTEGDKQIARQLVI